MELHQGGGFNAHWCETRHVHRECGMVGSQRITTNTRTRGGRREGRPANFGWCAGVKGADLGENNIAEMCAPIRLQWRMLHWRHNCPHRVYFNRQRFVRLNSKNISVQRLPEL